MSDERIWPKAPEIDEALIDFPSLPQNKKVAFLGDGLGKEALLPVGYEWRLGLNKELELWSSSSTPPRRITTAEIGEFGIEGAVRASVNTLYLEHVHALSSIGENISVTNLLSGNKFMPLWQGYTADNNLIPPTAQTPNGSLSWLEPNGATTVTTVKVPLSAVLTPTANRHTFEFKWRSGEILTAANVTLEVSTGGVVVYRKSAVCTGNVGGYISIPITYVSRLGGPQFTFTVKRDNGTLVSAITNTAGTLPYVALNQVVFTDTAVGLDRIGDVKESFVTTDHSGWVLLDGRLKSSLTASQQASATSLSWGTNIPDARDRVTIGAGSAKPLGTTGGSYSIAQNNLPNVMLTGSSSYTPAGTVGGLPGGNTPVSGAAFGGTRVADTGAGSLYAPTSATSWSNNVLANATFTGTVATVTLSNIRLNGNVAQTAFTQPYLAINKFVYLGL